MLDIARFRINADRAFVIVDRCKTCAILDLRRGVGTKLDGFSAADQGDPSTRRALDDTVIGHHAAALQLHPGAILQCKHAAPQANRRPVIRHGGWHAHSQGQCNSKGRQNIFWHFSHSPSFNS
jgi:hypothetical protein